MTEGADAAPDPRSAIDRADIVSGRVGEIVALVVEVERFRELLREASEMLHAATTYQGWVRHDLARRIDAALGGDSK